MENLNKTYNAINSLLNEVKELVKKNGGFINTTNLNKQNDQMYAYVYSWEYELLEEVEVIAVKVENNTLYIATCVKSFNMELYSIDELDEDDWYSVDMASADVLFIQTILSIAESIEQYV